MSLFILIYAAGPTDLDRLASDKAYDGYAGMRD